MIINAGLRRMNAAIRSLFNQAPFYAPLKNNLLLEKGTGSPTFTRTTTASVQNNDGYLVQALSGEARFSGARRIYNKFLASEDLSSASWLKTSTSIVGTTQIVEAAANSQHLVGQTASVVAGNTYIFQYKAKPNGRRYVALYLSVAGFAADTIVYFDLQAGTITSTGAGAISGSISSSTDADGYYLLTLTATATTTSAACPCSLYLCATANATTAYIGNGASGIYATDFQIEDVTAQTTQTAGEYVSVGSLSSPWHGAGVDGVKYFSVDINGNPIV